MTNIGNLIVHEYDLQTLVHRLCAGDGGCDGEDDVMTIIEELRTQADEIAASPSGMIPYTPSGMLERAASEIESLQKENKSIKPQLRFHIDLLETLLAAFDEHADGAPDATALDKFCNEMMGLYNGLLLGETRTLVQERNELRRQIAELTVKKTQVYNPPKPSIGNFSS